MSYVRVTIHFSKFLFDICIYTITTKHVPPKNPQVSTDNAICTTHYHASKLLSICSTIGCECTAGTTWQATYATRCVLRMGLSHFQHSATPFLHRCADMFYSLCIFSSPHNNYTFPVPKCVMNAYMKHVSKTCTYLSSQVEIEE